LQKAIADPSFTAYGTALGRRGLAWLQRGAASNNDKARIARALSG
jgi:hypothetical protein